MVLNKSEIEEIEKRDYIEKLVSINNISIDPKNPRRVQPSDELIGDIKENGVIKPIITWYNNEKYFTSDGWERYQAGVIAGLTEIPCYVYLDHIKALKATHQASIVNPYTDFHQYTYYKNFYDTCIESGMTHQEAIDRTVNDNPPIRENTLLRYLSIFDLPSPVQALMKEEKSLSKKEALELRRYDQTIKLKQRKLGIKVASFIASKLKGFPYDTICEMAVKVLRMKSKNAIRAIKMLSKNPEMKPYEIVTKIETGYEKNRILHAGDLIFEPDLRKIIVEYIASRFISTKIFIKELIEKWLLSTGKHSIFINPPKIDEKKEIKEISFKIRNNFIKIIQISGSTIIRLEGNTSLFFAHEEVKQRKWNEYMNIPSDVKKFLNNITIEFKDNQIDIKKKEENGIKKDKIINDLLSENKDLIEKVKELKKNNEMMKKTKGIKNKKNQDPVKNILYENLNMLFSKLEDNNNRINEIDKEEKKR